MFKFALVGAVGTVCHFLVLSGLVELLSVGEKTATAFGFLCGAIVNFILVRQFVFTKSDAPVFKSMQRFFTMALAFAVVNQVVFSLMVLTAHYLVAQIVATAVVFVGNYLVSKLWVFKE